MNKNNLTTEQENQISNLIRIIIEQSNLFPLTNPLLVKVPFLTLKESDISLSEAKDLIRYINIKIGTNESYIDILNGTIIKYERIIGTMVTEVFEELENVDIDDEKDSLILWVRNLDYLKKNIEGFFNIDVLSSKIKSKYTDGEIIIGKRGIKINQTSPDNNFCNIMFNHKQGTPIEVEDIWEEIDGKKTPVKLGSKELKSIENIKSKLNKRVKDAGVNQLLFRQYKRAMYRGY